MSGGRRPGPGAAGRSGLLPGETVVLREQRHWIVLVPAALFCLVLAALTAGLALRLEIDAEHSLLFLALSLFLPGLVLLNALGAWSATDFLLTSQRVILREGVVGRRTKVIALERIQDVSTACGALGRLCGYGRLQIDAAGEAGRETVERVRAPERLRDRIFREARRAQAARAGDSIL